MNKTENKTEACVYRPLPVTEPEALKRLRERDEADPFWVIPQDEPYFTGGSTVREDRVADRNEA